MPKTILPYRKLGNLFIECLSPDNRAVMAFGMVPKDQYDPFLESVLDNLARKLGEYYGVPAKEMRKHFKKEFLSEVELELGKAIYESAKNIMVV